MPLETEPTQIEGRNFEPMEKSSLQIGEGSYSNL